MSLDLEGRYREVIETLRKGHRYQRPIEASQRTALAQQLAQASGRELTMLLCLVENTSGHYQELEEPLCSLLTRDIDDDQIIYALNGIRRHLIARRFKEGKRLPAEFLTALDKLLHHSNAEVIEWTLRTIDECGAQSIYFKKSIQAMRPKLFAFFNKHQRAVFQLVDMFRRRWDNK